MKVQELRDCIRHAERVAQVDYHSCVTSHERRVWLGIATRVCAELEAASCPRATEKLIAIWFCAVKRLKILVNQVQKECDEADCNLQRMAFGGQYR